jgi:hypothetical protein
MKLNDWQVLFIYCQYYNTKKLYLQSQLFISPFIPVLLTTDKISGNIDEKEGLLRNVSYVIYMHT